MPSPRSPDRLASRTLKTSPQVRAMNAIPFKGRSPEPPPGRNGIHAMPSSDPDRAPSVGRRGFLTLVTRAVLWITGGASAFALGRYLAYEPPTAPSNLVGLEAPGAYPPGGMTLVAAGGAALYRDASGFFARSLTCGHLGCRVRPSEDGGFACPCHGSRFAHLGNRLHGPAARDLDGVALSLDEQGRLVLDLSTRVDGAWRLEPTAVPLARRNGSVAESGG